MYHYMNSAWSVFDQKIDGGSQSTPMEPVHLYVLINSCQGIGDKTGRTDNVFPSDGLWFGSDPQHELCCNMLSLLFLLKPNYDIY